MEILQFTREQKKILISQMYKRSIDRLLRFGNIHNKEIPKTRVEGITVLLKLLESREFVETIYQKLTSNLEVSKLYHELIWVNNKLDTAYAQEHYGLKLEPIQSYAYTQGTKLLQNEFGLIEQTRLETWRGREDFLELDTDFLSVLKHIIPKPKDYDLISLSETDTTLHNYDNTQGVLQFINTIEDLLSNNLVEFGKTGEKPLAKTINILKSTSGSSEFYTNKNIDSLATDMLTRTFYYYFKRTKKFKSSEPESLKECIKLQLGNNLDFFISRIFLAHLKKVRFDHFDAGERRLFGFIVLLVDNLISKKWVSTSNIINFALYRNIDLNIEMAYKTDYYTFEAMGVNIKGNKHYFEIYYEPMLKALLFYLGALGVLELRYNDPITPYRFDTYGEKAERISPWDGIQYIKITDLGLYLFGVKQSYQAKKITKKQIMVKFDEYKPLISIDKSDSITLAKIDPFVEKYEDKYILSHSKIFKNCTGYKALELKIDGFYKMFDTPLPKVFDSFFDQIKQNANLLKRDSKLITIELQNNKNLLHLFMTNKKLQELCIKASGYRILVAKADIPKLIKIVQDNGFFVSI